MKIIIDLHFNEQKPIHYKENIDKNGDFLIVPCAICGKNAVGRGYCNRYQEYHSYDPDDDDADPFTINICDPCEDDNIPYNII